MKKTKLYIYISLVISFLATVPCLAQEDKTHVYAQVETQGPIYQGESFIFSIVLENAEKADATDAEDKLAAFSPVGPELSQSSQTTIINNRIQTTRTIKMQYRLTVSEAGKITIPSITVQVSGQTYQTQPIELNIQTPAQSDQIALEMQLSKTRCYVGEPIKLIVSWYLLKNLADAEAAKNLEITVPAFLSDDFHIVDSLDMRQHEANNRISGQPVTLLQKPVKRDGTDFVRIWFEKVLIPKHTGTIQLKPAGSSVYLAVGRKRRRSFFESAYEYQRFAAVSQPVTLEVLPLPDGAPKAFYGLVGSYEITASAGTKNLRVGDPLTLTIRVTGDYLDTVQWPELEAIPEMRENFKIPSERSAPETEGSAKIFTQTIRPNNVDVARIPPIPLAYFDTEEHRYITKSSEPIPLEVEGTEVATLADVQGRLFSPVGREVEAVKQGISANYEGPDALTNQRFSILAYMAQPACLSMWALPLAAFMISAAAKAATQSSPQAKTARARKKAFKRAAAAVRKAGGSDSERREQLASAMRQFIGDRFGKTAGSLTSGDCEYIIANMTGDRPSAKAFSEILEACEAGAYAGLDVKIDTNTAAQLIQLMRNINRRACD